MRAACAPLVLLAVVAACSSPSSSGPAGSGGSATVSGTLAGRSVPTTDTIAITGTPASGGQEIDIIIGSPSGWCSAAQKYYVPPDIKVFVLSASSQTTVGPGSYLVSGGSTTAAGGGYSEPHYADQALSGTLTLTSVGPTSVRGTFDLVMVSNDRVTGSFDSPLCDAKVNYIHSL